MADDHSIDAELAALRQDGDLRRLGFGFLRLPHGELAAVHARYTPLAGLRAGDADELRRRITRSLEEVADRASREPPPSPLTGVPLEAREAFVLTLVRQHPRTRRGDAVVCQRCQGPVELCDVNRARASYLDPHLRTSVREEL